MRTSENIDQIVAALVKAQPNFRHPIREREGQVGNRPYKYADLPSTIDAVRNALNAEGIAIIQGVSLDVLTTILAHESGQWMASDYELPKGCTSQEMGSAITYGRRYCLSAMTAIAGDEDDDGSIVTEAERRTELTGQAIAELNASDIGPATPPNLYPYDEALRIVADKLIERQPELVEQFEPDGRSRRKHLVDITKETAETMEHAFLGDLNAEDMNALYDATKNRMRNQIADRQLVEAD